MALQAYPEESTNFDSDGGTEKCLVRFEKYLQSFSIKLYKAILSRAYIVKRYAVMLGKNAANIKINKLNWHFFVKPLEKNGRCVYNDSHNGGKLEKR